MRGYSMDFNLTVGSDSIVGNPVADYFSGPAGGNDSIEGGGGGDLIELFFYDGYSTPTGVIDAGINIPYVTSDLPSSLWVWGGDYAHAFHGTISLASVDIRNIDHLFCNSSGPIQLSILQLTSFSEVDMAGSNCSLQLTGSGGSVELASRMERFGSGATVNASALTSSLTLGATSFSDKVTSTKFSDTIVLADGNDTANGGQGNDTLSGGAGNDQISGSYGADQIGGGSGNDTIHGGYGWDCVWGGGGDDQLAGGPGNDRLYGGAGWDTLWGGYGDDTLSGGTGQDRLVGGFGADTFLLTAVGGHSVATITDFTHSSDTIALDHAGFTALTAGALDPAALLIRSVGNEAETASTRVIYDSATGNLSYDADGSGSAANAVVIAHLTAGLSLDNNDFKVI